MNSVWRCRTNEFGDDILLPEVPVLICGRLRSPYFGRSAVQAQSTPLIGIHSTSYLNQSYSFDFSQQLSINRVNMAAQAGRAASAAAQKLSQSGGRDQVLSKGARRDPELYVSPPSSNLL